MPAKKSFLLRLPHDLWNEMNRWAQDELRSVNGQIEYVLREALRRRKKTDPKNDPPEQTDRKRADP
jgi:hypothetical protein